MFRILFVCLGNSCRSQMAEGFARAYGNGVWEAASAGLMPASIIARLTRQVMSERGVDLGDQFQKPLEWVRPESFDLVVNLTDLSLPDGITSPVRVCEVRDPIGSGERVYRQVRDDIERLVLGLLNEVRTRAAPAP